VPEPPAPKVSSHAEATPLVLIPVTAEDVARTKRRKIVAWAALALTAAAIGGWIYKRSTDPLRAQDSFDAAQRLFAAARYNQAAVACDRAIGLKPDFAEAYLLRGKAHVAQYDLESGIPDFSKAVELRPGEPQALLERAHAYIDEKNYTAAVADLNAALSKDPKLARGYNLRGMALRALGQPEKAVADFARAAELEPNSDNFYQRGATYQMLGDNKNAILDFTEAIAYDPDKPQGYFARAEAERAAGDMEKAKKDHDYGRYLDGH